MMYAAEHPEPWTHPELECPICGRPLSKCSEPTMALKILGLAERPVQGEMF